MLSICKQEIESLELEPGSGGCFEVSVDDNLIYSKLKTGEFPDETALADQIQAML
ncbi:MAG TPA: SelT/SelW/SelH family protein [Planctomycetaceae bacterium]|nr:SelT/SelW/SelH family protein [Planctomycetaceae bacterium]